MCSVPPDKNDRAGRLDAIRIQSPAASDDAAWSRLCALAGQMERDGHARADPIREIFSLIGDRWTMLILLTLEAREWSHSDLRRIVGTLSYECSISQRVLTLKLRALERNGLVLRRTSDDIPPRVSYRLSELGLTLMGEAHRLLKFLRDNTSGIEEARRAFDSVEESESPWLSRAADSLHRQ